MSSPCEMAAFGHSGSHAPQLMHSSVMKVAIRFSCRDVRDAGQHTTTDAPARCTREGRPENSFGCASVPRPLRGDAAVDRADRGARRRVVLALALRALRAVDDVDLVGLADRAVRALGLAGAAVDALLGNLQGHLSSSSLALAPRGGGGNEAA